MSMKRTTRKKDNTTSEIVGAGVGVAGGAAAGAAAGSLAGPIGTAIGAIGGGVAGAFAGKEIADYIDPGEEETYWSKEYTNRPYYKEGTEYETYRPAYRYGVEAGSRYPGKSFEEVEKRLSRNWPRSRGDSKLTWSQARGPVQDAYTRAIQLHEERLEVDKEQVEMGEVEIHKEVKTRRQTIDVPVEREEVVIHRRSTRGEGTGGKIGAESEVIRIPVKEERVRVSKKTVPVEEVSVGRRKIHDVEHIDENLRKEEVKVEEKGGAKVRETGRTRKS